MDAGPKTLRDMRDENPDAARFNALFASLYHRFHRRVRADAYVPSPEALGVLRHLSRNPPLTVTAAARHFDRSQAPMSEIPGRLEERGLLARRSDSRHRRRALSSRASGRCSTRFPNRRATTMSETANATCKSCSMPIETGNYCRYCADENGNLIPFDECVERFLQWTRRHEPDLAPDAARRKTLEFMATIPAWCEHPDLRRELEGA